MSDNQTAEPKDPHAMTVQELQAEIGRLQSILHWRVAGDPRQSVTVPTTPRWPRGYVRETL